VGNGAQGQRRFTYGAAIGRPISRPYPVSCSGSSRVMESTPLLPLCTTSSSKTPRPAVELKLTRFSGMPWVSSRCHGSDVG
jgi:hypothetical protein